MALTLFYICAALAVICSLAMVLNIRNPVAGAMNLVVAMIMLAVIYLLLEAYLVAAIQIMVYAGAIVVVFLFVVMLLNLRTDHFPPARQNITKLIGVALGVYGLFLFVRSVPGSLPAPVATVSEGFGGYREVGTVLYTDFVFAFEITSFLLLGAMVGAVVLAKRKLGN